MAISSSIKLSLSGTLKPETAKVNDSVSSQLSFKSVLSDVNSRDPQASKLDGVISQVSDFGISWRSSSAKVERTFGSLSGELGEMFSLQREMQTLSLQTQMISKLGEAAVSTVKRLQNMNQS